MTDFTVTTAADDSFDGADLAAETADGGGLSLREALGLVNAAAAGASIGFDAALDGGTLALTGGALRIERNVDISGDLTIDAEGLSRVLTIVGGAAAVIDGIDFTGGSTDGDGGGILVQGGASLTLTDAVVAGNSAGFGGGIAVDVGAALIGRDLRVLGNSAGVGGGIGMRDDVHLLNAEIGGNFAYYGGGVEIADGDLRLINATVHGNYAIVAGGGIDAFGGDFTMTFTTVTGNAAGQYAGGIFDGDNFISRVGNSIIAGNAARSGADITSVNNRLRYEGANILGTRVHEPGVGNVAPDDDDVTVLTDAGLTVADVFLHIDPITGGGLVTNTGPGLGRDIGTAALLNDGSNPAVAAAQFFSNSRDFADLDGDGRTSELLPLDARGMLRKAVADLGASEAPPFGLSGRIDTVADVVDASDGLTSLREAVQWANSGWLAGPLVFANGAGEAFEGGGTIALKEELAITGAVSLDGDLDGDGVADVTLDGRGDTRIFNVTGGDLTLNGMVLSRGRSYLDDGGAILVNDGALALSDTQIRGGNSAVEGGGIAAVNSELVLVNTEIRGGGSRDGGGMALTNSRAALTNVSITDNQGANAGGLLVKDGSEVDMVNVTIAHNSATTIGGVLIVDADVRMVQSTVAANFATNLYEEPHSAGGIQVEAASHLTLANSIVAGNRSPNDGQQDMVLRAGAELTVEGTALTRIAPDMADGATRSGPGALLALEDMTAGLWDVFAAKGEGGRPAMADNGGTVRTVALLNDPSNPALMAGDPALLPADVHDLDGDGDRAEPLPISANGVEIDPAAPGLGAFALERAEAPSLTVTTAEDVVDAHDGLISLREAAGWAQDGTLSGPVLFAKGLTALALDAEITVSGTLAVTGEVAITGAARVFNVTGGDLTLSGVSLTGGDAGAGAGGLIAVTDGTLDLRHGDLTGGAAATGGAIHALRSTVTLADVHVGGNSATTGGGIAMEGGTLELGAVSIIGNDAVGDGGGLHADGTRVTAMNLTLGLNDAGGAGGGAFMSGGNSVFLQTTVAGNAAAGGGGLALDGDAELIVVNAIVAGNAGAAADMQVSGGAEAVIGGKVLLGTAAGVDGASALTVSTGNPDDDIAGDDATLLLLEDMPQTIDQVLSMGAEGPNVSDGDGHARVIALARDAGNPALAAGVSRELQSDFLDLDADGIVNEALSLDAALRPILAIAPDLGAAASGNPAPSALIVTTAADDFTPFDETMSLRDAIFWAGKGVDGTITFDAGIFAGGGTIRLNGTELLVSGQAVTIDGDLDDDGIADITLDAGGLSRVLRIDETTEGRNTIEGVVITGGAADNGGGVLVERYAGVDFVNTVIEDNAATGAGGGIFVDGARGLAYVGIFGGAIRGNTADTGGGAAAVGDVVLNLTGTLVAGNDAARHGGGIALTGGDASLQSMITNATIANNSALLGGGGIVVGSGANAILALSTVTGNDAPVGAAALLVDEDALAAAEAGAPAPEELNGGSLYIADSIIAGNGADPTREIAAHDPSRAQVSGNGALLAGHVHDLVTGAQAAPTMFEGAEVTLLDERFDHSIADVFAEIDPETGGGLLADNGGRQQTVALNPVAGNPAIDASTAEILAELAFDYVTDVHDPAARPFHYVAANGVARLTAFGDPADEARPDFGAFETAWRGTPSLVVTTTADVLDAHDGETSLREAMAWAADGTLDGVITFAHGVGDAFETGGTIMLNGTELTASGRIEIDGDLDDDGVADITIDAQGLSRVLHVNGADGNTDVSLTGIVLTNGRADHGGAVLAEGDGYFTLIHGAVANSTATGGGDEGGRGGGVLTVGGYMWTQLIDSALIGNRADIGGGAAIVGGDLWMTGGLIADNAAGGHGGGVAVISSDTEWQSIFHGANLTVANNSAGIGGGAIASERGGLTALINATVTGNDAAMGAALLLAGTAEAFTDRPEEAEVSDNAWTIIADSIIAGNGTDPAGEIATHSGDEVDLFGAVLLSGPMRDIATGAVATPNTEHERELSPPVYDETTEEWVHDTEIVTANVIDLSQLPQVGLADVFDAIDPIAGGGLLAENGGRFASVALRADIDNPAVDAGDDWFFAGIEPGVRPDSDALLHDAAGGPRMVAFIDPAAEARPDLGASEASRQVLTDLAGPLPGGAPVLADLGAGAADLRGAAQAFDNAAFLNMGGDDALLFEGATSATQFSHADNMLTYDADGDGVAEAQVFLTLGPRAALRYSVGDEGVTVSAAQAAAIGEVTQLTVGTSWQTLTFANTYKDPVVFALSPSLNEAESVATRFKNVTGAGAEIRLQEPKRVIDPETGLQTVNPGDHVDETVTLLVLEKGVHTLEDGTVIQAGELSTNKLYVKGFEDVAFAQDFETAPSIFSQVQTVNGTDFIISRQRNPDVDGFQLTMQEEQADNINHAHEDVGWFAIEHGSGALTDMSWQAGSSSRNVNGKLTQVMFDDAFDEAPLVVASLASYNGTDTASPRIGSVSPTRFHAMALEDQSHDLETNHGYEIVDWMAFSSGGTLFEQTPAAQITTPGQRVAATGFASVGHEATTISFDGSFLNPVVIASLTSANDAGAAVARVSNVTATGFELAVQETGEQDGIHGPEDISWIVVEAGSWVLADGTVLQAGLTDLGATTRQGFASVAFDAGFDAGPAVLSQTQTGNDAAFVKTRMQSVDDAGFAVALEEDEASSWGGHGAESVGWIAVDMGAAADADGFVFEAGTLRTNHKTASAAFESAFDGPLGVVAGTASFGASDTVAARIDGVTADGFAAHLEEDVSLNPETGHGHEDIHWLAWSGEGDVWGDALV